MTDAPDQQQREGLVVRVDAKRCHVEVDDAVYLLSPRGKLFGRRDRVRNPIAVGDRVLVTIADGGGSIDSVLPRRSKLARATAGEGRQEQVLVANVDRVLVVSSILDPEFRPALVDRILIGAERGGIDAQVVVTKVDLEPGEPEGSRKWAAFYERLGYTTHLCSIITRVGIDEMRAVFADHITVVSGLSGVGKSSLLNAVDPELSLRVGDISARWREGRHTTTHTSLLRLSGGGHVVDTPGIRNFGLFGLEPQELASFLPEFASRLGECRFNDCLHRIEPGCAIRAAVEAGSIARSRYESYLALLDECESGLLDG